MPKGNKFPPDVIRHWPEVLSDVEIQTIPIQYLVSIRVEFTDGTVWEVELDKDTESSKEEIEDSLGDFFDEYSDSISNIDFRMDTERVIKDVKNRTRQFLKKRR